MTVNTARPCIGAALVACGIALALPIEGCSRCSDEPASADVAAEAAIDDKGGVPIALSLDDDGRARATKLVAKIKKGRFPERVARRKGQGQYFVYLAAKSKNPEVIKAALGAMAVAYVGSAAHRSGRPRAGKDYTQVVLAHLKSKDKKIQRAALLATPPLLRRSGPDPKTLQAVIDLLHTHEVVGGRIEAASALLRIRDLLTRTVTANAVLRALDDKDPALLSHLLARLPSRVNSRLVMKAKFQQKVHQLMKHTDPGVRGRALRLAAAIDKRDVAARAGVLTMLEDPHAYTRSCAALAAAVMGDPAAIHRLMAKVDDSAINRYSISYRKLEGGRAGVAHGPAKEPVNDPVARAIESLSSKMKEPYRRPSKKKDAASMKRTASAAKAWYEKHKSELPPAESFVEPPKPGDADQPGEQKSGHEKASKDKSAGPKPAAQPLATPAKAPPATPAKPPAAKPPASPASQPAPVKAAQ